MGVWGGLCLSVLRSHGVGWWVVIQLKGTDGMDSKVSRGTAERRRVFFCEVERKREKMHVIAKGEPVLSY